MSASKIGRFEIISEVAHSEYSSVYKATDTATGRAVALKAFNLALAGEDRVALVQRLLHEAESTRSLSHQNIVLLYGAGEIDEHFCVATEYVEGFSVAANIAKGERFTVWDMVDISRQVCNGLDHAATHGVVHKRLHPANVLVQWDGTVKILGFGITGMWSEEDSLGLLSPTSYYASPEQVRGEALDARSNLYSWGAILYAMSTGHAPSEVVDQPPDVESVREQILAGTPVPPILLSPKMTPALNHLILKALSKNPEDRYQSGKELLIALETCKESPKSAGLDPKTATNPVAPKISATPVMRAAAAAGASAHGSSGANNIEIQAPPSSRSAGPVVEASAGVAEEESPTSAVTPAFTPTSPSQPRTASPKISFDPMMAGEAATGGGGRSFSEISELPPLKQQYVPSLSPTPEPAAEPETDPAPAIPPSRRSPDKIGSGKKLTMPAMPQVDSKLLIHGLGGGLAVVLLVAACVFLYVRMHTSDDEGSIPPAAPAAQTDTAAKSATDATPADATPAQATPAQATPAQDSGAQEAPTAAQSQSQPQAVQPSPRTASTSGKGKRDHAVAPKSIPVAAAAQILVDSTPQGAQIQIDGRFDPSWVTPFTLTGIAPGQHTLTVTKSGYANDTRSLNIASGSKSVLAIHLNAVSAAIAVSSDPAGAAIFVDGRDSGRVTPSQVTLEKGSHTIVVRKAGYLDESTSADAQPGTTLSFGAHLRQLGSTDEIRTVNKIKKLWGGNQTEAGMGTITVRTNPKGAQISVNQRLIDKPSPAEFLLNPGNYIVEITASGYKPVRRVINVEKNSKQAIEETLEKE